MTEVPPEKPLTRAQIRRKMKFYRTLMPVISPRMMAAANKRFGRELRIQVPAEIDRWNSLGTGKVEIGGEIQQVAGTC